MFRPGRRPWHHVDGSWKSGLRWSVAQILVSLPVLWVVQRTIGRDTACA
jgi:hypothetical protein